jgi:hypothetical protein
MNEKKYNLIQQNNDVRKRRKKESEKKQRTGTHQQQAYAIFNLANHFLVFTLLSC